MGTEIRKMRTALKAFKAIGFDLTISHSDAAHDRGAAGAESYKTYIVAKAEHIKARECLKEIQNYTEAEKDYLRRLLDEELDKCKFPRPFVREFIGYVDKYPAEKLAHKDYNLAQHEAECKRFNAAIAARFLEE